MSQQESSSNNAQSQFLVRLTSLPVVNTAFELATHTYGRVKNVNPIVGYTLNAAEKSVLFANSKAQPLVHKYQKQITIADELACRGLEKLEETVPLITKPTDMIVQDTRTLYNNTIKMGKEGYEGVKSYGFNKVNAVKQYGYDTASGLITSPYVKLVKDSVNGCLTVTENCLDHYLPPVDENCEDKDQVKEQEVLLRVTRLTNRIKHRALCHALLKASQMKQTTEESLQKYHTADVLNLTQEAVSKTYSSIYSNASWAWEQLNAEPTSLSDNPTLNEQVLSTARHTTKHLVSVFVTAKATVQEIPTRMNSVFDLTHTVFEHLKKLSPQELAALITHLRDVKVGENVNYVITILSRNSVLQWLVQNKGNQQPEADE